MKVYFGFECLWCRIIFSVQLGSLVGLNFPTLHLTGHFKTSFPVSYRSAELLYKSVVVSSQSTVLAQLLKWQGNFCNFVIGKFLGFFLKVQKAKINFFSFCFGIWEKIRNKATKILHLLFKETDPQKIQQCLKYIYKQ
jgi:hypothetical protein